MSTYLAAISIGFKWLAVLAAVYLAVILLKQALKRSAEPRSVLIVTALLLVPSLLTVLFVYEGDVLQVFDKQAEINRNTDNWWIVAIGSEPEPPATLWAYLQGQQKEEDRVTVNLLGAALAIAVIYILITFLIWVASNLFMKWRRAEWLAIHKALVKWPVVLVGACVCLKIDVGTILLGTSVAVIGLGLVLKEMLENLFSGMALEVEGTIRQGDWIRYGDSEEVGKVYEKGWRVTKIRTLDDEMISIPNRLLAAEKVLNFNRPVPYHARNLYVGTSYDDPPVKVKEILRTILIREPEVLNRPSPLVRTIEYGDFAINFEMKFWIRDYSRRNFIEDAIMTHIWYSFKFYGVTIPFPIRTVHLKEREELAEEDRLIEGDVDTREAFLRSLDTFDCLVAKDFDFLARNAFRRRFDPGEHIVHRGEIGDALYITMEGWCEAVLPDGRRRRLDAGQYFGEMGLLGAKPRTADVVAGEEGALVMRIDKHCMDVLFRAYPGLIDGFHSIREERERDLQIEEDDRAPRRQPLHSRLARGVKDILKPW